jgi:Type ISP C-terminal specificity domain
MPRISASGAIFQDPAAMPDTISYDAIQKKLVIGEGYVDNVEPSVWGYEVSGKQVLLQWFSYRKANRERPIIGDRRPPSPLGEIQPEYWLAEYTTELINLLNVLSLRVDLEPIQAALLEKICAAPSFQRRSWAQQARWVFRRQPRRKLASPPSRICSVTRADRALLIELHPVGQPGGSRRP